MNITNNPLVYRGQKVNYVCIRCGRCCSSGPNVALTVFDVCRIARFLNTNWRELVGKGFYAIIADYIPVIILQGLNNRCVFLRYFESLPTCAIYPARPMRCRLYPFIPIAPTNESTLELSTRCPGVGRGPLSDPPWDDLKQYLNEVRKHYALIYDLVFSKGFDPLKALESTLDMACGTTENDQPAP